MKKTETNKRALFLGLPGRTFSSMSFIPKDDRILLIDRKNIQSAAIQKELSTYKTIVPVDEYYDSGEVSWAAVQCFHQTPYSHIISLSESDILRAGALRDYLNIEGQSLESAQAFRDKIIMRELLKASGLPTTPFKRLAHEIELLEFVQRHGYPVIVRPIKGYGALDTFVLKTEEDLELLIKKPLIFDEFQRGNLFVESFVTGQMYHVDGLVYQREVIFMSPSAYSTPTLEMNRTDGSTRKGYSASYMLPKDCPDRESLLAFTKTVMKTLPTPQNSAFFLQAFKSSEGDFVLCEVASRVGGHPNPHVAWQAFGIDLKNEFIRLQCGFAPSFSWHEEPKEYLGSIVLGTEDGKFKGLEPMKQLPWIQNMELFISKGDVCSRSSGFLSLAAYFILSADNRESFIGRTETLASLFYSTECWE